MMLVEVLKLLFVATMAMTAAEAIWLEMPSSGTKCVYEEIHHNVVVFAKYAIIGDQEHAQADGLLTMSVEVISPLGNHIHHEKNVTYSEFGFTTTEVGNYMACFIMNRHAPGSKGVTIGIDWKTGIAAKDWDSLARKEKIEDVELVLMRLQALVQAVHEKLIYMKKRDEEMREVSERTNASVAWYSIMSLCICILAAAVQIWHLKRFFRKKRLL